MSSEGGLIFALVALLSNPLTALAQRSRASFATTPKPSRIVLERTDVNWCFEEILGRVDLTEAVNRRMGMRVRLEASPRDLVEVPNVVIARPWAPFVIHGKHRLEMPPRMNPTVMRVTITAEAGGGSAMETLTIHAGSRTRRACRTRIEAAGRAEIDGSQREPRPGKDSMDGDGKR